MSLRTVMQAGPLKASDLFARLLDTSDGAVKTREKLFTELKTELELHTSLEEQHLFPVLRRNAETKELVAEAIKDNKELRAKLSELDALPKNDDLFPERLKDLQKTFRQHARDEKRELLPAVQKALSEEQVQGVAEKMEAGVAGAEQARQDEAEERRLKARQERERAERQAERQAEAERVRQEAAARQEEAEQEAAAQRAREEARQRARDTAEAVTKTAVAAQTGVLRVVSGAAKDAQQVGAEIQGVARTSLDAMQRMVPEPTIAALPRIAIAAATNFRSAWIDWMNQTIHANAQMSQKFVLQAAEQQQRFALDTMQRWIEHSARVANIGIQATQDSLRLPKGS